MNEKLTEIVMVVDRSGSMSSIQSDAEGGINSFIEDQKTGEGDAMFTLVEFDDRHNEVYSRMKIGGVGGYKLRPRGWTCLYDALGKTIVTAGERLASIPEEKRPGTVIFVIVTDGRENSSKEYTAAQIKEMIARQEKEYSWQFVYLGANQDAFAEGGKMGIGNAVNYDPSNVGKLYKMSSDKVKGTRAARASGQSVSSAACNLDFDPDEQAELVRKDK